METKKPDLKTLIRGGARRRWVFLILVYAVMSYGCNRLVSSYDFGCVQSVHIDTSHHTYYRAYPPAGWTSTSYHTVIVTDKGTLKLRGKRSVPIGSHITVYEYCWNTEVICKKVDK